MNSNRHVQWSLACFFGWLLTFPFSGPVLSAVVPQSDTAANLALIFIGAHGITLLATGLLVKQRFWEKMLLIGASLCGVGHFFLLVTGLAWYPQFAMAIMGLGSAVFVLGWTHPYSMGIRPESRIKTMAATIILANIILFLLNFLSNYISPTSSLVVSLIPLAGALYYSRQIQLNESTPAKKEPGPLPAKHISFVCIFILMIYINGGFLYNLIYPTVEAVPGSHYFKLLAYIAVLIVIWMMDSRIKKTLLVYLGASVMGLAFVLFGLFGGSVLGSAIISLLVESSFGFIDLFTWTIPAAISYLYKSSFRVYGIILSVNVSSIFIGYLLGEQLLIQENYEITTGLFASAIIFLAFLIMPWLKDFSEKETTASPRLNIQLKELNLQELLTPRELEILGLVLEGHSNKKTAALIFISENTLKTHLKSIYSKLGISHKRELFSLIVSKGEAPPKTS